MACLPLRHSPTPGLAPRPAHPASRAPPASLTRSHQGLAQTSVVQFPALGTTPILNHPSSTRSRGGLLLCSNPSLAHPHFSRWPPGSAAHPSLLRAGLCNAPISGSPVCRSLCQELSCPVSFSRKPSLTHSPRQAFPRAPNTTGPTTLGCHPTWTLTSLRAGPRAVSSLLCLQHSPALGGGSKNSKQLQNHWNHPCSPKALSSEGDDGH